MRVAWGFGLLHALTDVVTVTVLYRAARMHEAGVPTLTSLVICYTLLAFGSQLGLGWLQDRYAAPRVGVLTGLALSSAGVASYRLLPVASVVLVGLASAAFHVGAGAAVLGLGLDRATRAGFFAAPGALGSGLGLWFGQRVDSGPLWPLALVTTLALGGAVALTRAADQAAPVPVRSVSDPTGAGAGVVLSRVATAATGLLVLSIAARSLVGMSAERGHSDGAWLFIGIPAAGFLGKALGGLLADRVGWARTVVVALVASAGCLAMPGTQGIGTAPVLLLGGLLCLHSTMPVMLVAVGRLMPARLGLAFGWDHFALAVGAVPTMVGWGDGLTGKPMQAAWILLAVVAVPVALRVCGTGGRRRQLETGPERPALPLGMAGAEP